MVKRILFATSEVYPLIKTGGLADVSGSLPRALQAAGHEVRVILPAYGDVIENLDQAYSVGSFKAGDTEVELIETILPGSDVITWLVSNKKAFGRSGNPYMNEDGNPWVDNAERFHLFDKAVVELAQGRAGPSWKPDLVHCHDWQTGLVPALLSMEPVRPATVFTIHNLAYQGLFDYDTFQQLNLPDVFWHHETLEYFGQMSFMKGGLIYADQLTTVSPSYAEEIQTPEFGCGLDGLLGRRSDSLTGIVNGIDTNEWNPARDQHLIQTYSKLNLERKLVNKTELCREFALPVDTGMPLIGMIGRLVSQKGIDLVLQDLDQIVALPAQLVILGSGESKYENQLREAVKKYSDRISVYIGYDEGLAHRIEAGADIFLMPSRFEPCGLNQMYSLRYGTIPVVHSLGGLADTVVTATPENIQSGIATGVTFYEPDAEEMHAAIRHAVALYKNKAIWKQMQLTAMRQDFSWSTSAAEYSKLYYKAMENAVMEVG